MHQTDVLGVRRHARSRQIMSLIANALLAECEGDIGKELEIRDELHSLLSSPGTIREHRDWEQTIKSNNNIRVGVLRDFIGQGVNQLARNEVFGDSHFTHWLAHQINLELESGDCSVCQWLPLTTPAAAKHLEEPPSNKLDSCDCWVRTRPREEQFGLRWGAHSRLCPAFRESQDPVDRDKDNLNREYGEAHFGGTS